MTKGTTRPLEIPKEMQAVTEQSVEQAKLAFNSYFQGNCPGCGLGSEQAEGIRQGCRIAGQGVDDGPALLLGG